MPEPRLPNLIRGILNYTTPTGPASNVIHFRNDSAEPFGSAVTFINNVVKAWWGSTIEPSRRLRNWVHNGTSLNSVRYVDFSVLNGQEVELTNDVNPQGGGGVNRMPPDLAIVVSWLTGNTGPRNRGRLYIPSLAVTTLNQATGNIDASAQGSLAAGANLFLSDLSANLTPLVIFSRVGAVMREVLTATVDTHWDVQRRRGSD